MLRRVAVTPVQVAQLPAVGDQLQDRLVGHLLVADAALSAVGRDADAGDPEARQAVVEGEVAVVLAAVGDLARPDVVEEPAPLVVVDEQDPAPILRRLDEGVDDVGHERLADADVAVRVLVAGGSLVLPQEGGVDEGDVGQLAGGGVGVELRDGVHPGAAAAAVEGREGEVRVVVAGGEAARDRPVEDRLPREPTGGRKRISLRCPRPAPPTGSGGWGRSSP